MLIDFAAPDGPAPGHTEVCIIGAGAAGILLATKLSAAGKSVTLLEGGGLQLEATSQDIYRSHLTGLPHKGIYEGRYRTYGGTTTMWGGQILELDAFDFEPRPHVPGSGWPFPKFSLTSFYQRALSFEGLRRVEREDAAIWRDLGLQPPDLGPEFSTLYSRWCPERNFAVLHDRELRHSRRLKVYVHANVTGFVLNDARSAIRAVHVRSLTGRHATVTADIFILCLGGIETNRLLLQPLEQGTAPWQTNGLLGRHYQDHIGLSGIPINHIATQPAYQYFGYVTSKGFRYHSKLHLSLTEQAKHKTLNIAGTISPALKENRGRDRANVLLRALVRERKKPTTAEALKAALHVPAIAAHLLSQRLRGEAPEWRRTMLNVHCEQSPLSASHIALSTDRDPLGLLRTSLHWEISSEELHTLRTYVKIAVEVFAAKSFASIHVPFGFFEDDTLVRSMCGDSNHHMGGTRMSAAPCEGIVDTDLKLHGLSNGYICSSSVFPSSGFSNPTHTVLALAMRLADHIGIAGPAPDCGLSGLALGFNPTVEVSEGKGFNPGRLRSITLPGTPKPMTQLGFGCAYLLGPGLDHAKSRRLLDAAYDAGIRHFDAARLYGQGHTEALLGDFLRQHTDATVTTKYGIVPPNTPQRVVEALQRRIPAFGRRTQWLRRNDKAKFTATDARASLETSLRQLGRDHVELFLLHEPTVADLAHDDLLEFLQLQQKAGKIGNFGSGGEFYRMPQLHRERSGYARILQFEASIFGPALDLPGAYRIHYRTFARPAAALSQRFADDPQLASQWSQAVGADLEEPQILSRLLLKASLDQHPASLTLFSTASEQHIFDNVSVAQEPTLTEPAQRLHALVAQNKLGLDQELYSIDAF